MIGRLTGKIEEKAGRCAIINCAGVGYEVLSTAALFSNLEIGETRSVVVYTDVREDSIRLFGFIDATEKQVFSLLMQVSGIGAKTALDIVSAVDKLELLRAIGAGDLAKLQSIKGIGKKTAERLIVELREKVGEYAAGFSDGDIAVNVSRSVGEGSPIMNDARDALVALGFGKADAERALSHVSPKTKNGNNSGELVKEALRYI